MDIKGRSQMIMVGFLVAFLAMVTLVIAGDTATHNVTATATLGNTAPVVNSVTVQNSGTYNPTVHSTTAIAIRMNVTDNDGWNTINLTAGASSCNVTKGSVTRTLATCTWISTISSTQAVFECTGTMNYYDLTGADWAASCRAVDNSGQSHSNTGSAMTYGRLESIDIINGTSVSWPGLSQDSTNVGATDDPVIAANWGNAHFNNLNITAYNLTGVTNASQGMLASDFTANDANAADGDILANAVSKAVTDCALPIGTSIDDISATEGVYLYLEQISNKPIQIQSYTASSPWVLTVWNATNTN